MKIMMFGRPGSGKSTCAFELAQKIVDFIFVSF